MSEATHDRRLVARIARFLKEPGKRLQGYWFQLRGTVPYHLAYALRRPFAREPRTLYFFPALPEQYNATILRVCMLRGIRVAQGTPADRPLMSWEDETVNRLPAPAGALNGRCTDIRKSTVDELHRAIFGYGAAVDPLTWTGRLVEKSEGNAAHDGVIHQGPLAAVQPGKVYQRLLDNVRGGMHEELRIPIVMGTIPHVVVCRKKAAVRFDRLANAARLAETSAVLSAVEIGQIRAFCEAIGLDFGELDAIRDPADGRLYVIDANKTPIGPVRALPLWAILLSLHRVGRDLDRLWLRHAATKTPPS